MLEFTQLVQNSHQVFFALVICALSFFLVMDLPELKEMATAESRKFMVLILGAFTLGTFALLFNAWEAKGLFLAIEFSLLVMFSLIHPKYAISFLVYLLLSRPWESYDNQMMASMPRDVSYLTLISLLAHKIFKKQYYFRFNMGTFLLLGFSVWLFMSGFFSQHADEAIVQFLDVFMKGVILFILIQNGIEKSREMLPIKAVFVLAILEKCFVSFYKSNIMQLPTIVENVNERLESVGILSNSNDIAAIFVLAIPFTIFFILKTKIKPFNWIVALVASLAMILLVWQSQSRGALLGIFAIFGAYTLIRIKSKKLLALAIVFGIVGTLGAFKMMNRDSADVEGSTNNRILFWKAGLNMAIRNPIFGVGFWGYPRNLPAYAIGGDFGTEKDNMTAHSSWVLALGEGGFAALFLFAGLWLYGAFAAWKIRIAEPEYFMGIAGYGMAITFLSHTYLLYPYILLALVITHYQIDNGLKHTRGLA